MYFFRCKYISIVVKIGIGVLYVSSDQATLVLICFDTYMNIFIYTCLHGVTSWLSRWTIVEHGNKLGPFK